MFLKNVQIDNFGQFQSMVLLLIIISSCDPKFSSVLLLSFTVSEIRTFLKKNGQIDNLDTFGKIIKFDSALTYYDPCDHKLSYV